MLDNQRLRDKSSYSIKEFYLKLLLINVIKLIFIHKVCAPGVYRQSFLGYLKFIVRDRVKTQSQFFRNE